MNRYIYIYTYTYILCVYIYVHTHRYVCVYIYIYTFICCYTHTYIFTYMAVSTLFVTTASTETRNGTILGNLFPSPPCPKITKRKRTVYTKKHSLLKVHYTNKVETPISKNRLRTHMRPYTREARSCVCAYACVSIHTHTHTRTSAYVRMCIGTCLHAYIPTYPHTHIPTDLHTQIPKYPNTEIPQYLHTYHTCISYTWYHRRIHISIGTCRYTTGYEGALGSQDQGMRTAGRASSSPDAILHTLGIHQRGVQSEGGAVDGGSII